MKELVTKMKEALLTVQKYRLGKSQKGTLYDRYELEVSLECIELEKRMLTITSTMPTGNGRIILFFKVFNNNDEDLGLLMSLKPTLSVSIRIWEKGASKGSETTEMLGKLWAIEDTNELLISRLVSSERE